MRFRTGSISAWVLSVAMSMPSNTICDRGSAVKTDYQPRDRRLAAPGFPTRLKVLAPGNVDGDAVDRLQQQSILAFEAGG